MSRYENLSGFRIIVVGLGVSGYATARALAAAGASVRVTEAATSDAIEDRAAALRAAGIEVEIGGHDLDNVAADFAVVSPGVPPTSPIVGALRRGGVDLVGEVELAVARASCDFLAVTGTNGKTTTTSMLAAILAEANVPSLAAGNIGLPLIEAVSMVPPGGAIVLEVSSFQLELIPARRPAPLSGLASLGAPLPAFRPRVAVLLNIAPDHIDWHGTYDAYVEAKARIVENQTVDDVFLPNFEDDAAMKIAHGCDARVVPFSAYQIGRAHV